MQRDFIIVGGGIVGISVAYGLARLGRKVCVIDSQAMNYKASRGNAGLVWVQGKGFNMPSYAKLSYDSSRMWPEFSQTLQASTGIDIEYQQKGGIDICLTAAEAKELRADYQQFYSANPSLNQRINWQYLDNQGLAEHFPGLGSAVHGGIWSAHDGQCNPLNLLHALYKACDELGVEFQLDAQVESVSALAGGFSAQTRNGVFSGDRIILAAGLGVLKLAPSLGLSSQVKPIRGQVLITEKCPLRHQLPSPQIRQMGNGSYLIGFSYEDVGYKRSTQLDTISELGSNALAIYPELENTRLVRSWSALRIMTPDGCPVYEASRQFPGAYSLNCHSGITLSAFHAQQLSAAIEADLVTEQFAEFSGSRFNV